MLEWARQIGRGQRQSSERNIVTAVGAEMPRRASRGQTRATLREMSRPSWMH